MKNKILAEMLMILMVLMFAIPAFALPEPKTAYYPRGGRLTLSPTKEINNSYAFRATGKTDNKVVLSINGAYAETCGTVVQIQMFIVNKWGNWIAFGTPETFVLDCESFAHEFIFTIRPRKEFCIVVSSYGIEGSCVIPYQVATM